LVLNIRVGAAHQAGMSLISVKDSLYAQRTCGVVDLYTGLTENVKEGFHLTLSWQ